MDKTKEILHFIESQLKTNNVEVETSTLPFVPNYVGEVETVNLPFIPNYVGEVETVNLPFIPNYVGVKNFNIQCEVKV
jgi:hypothetical protein